jgi:hypothetical protein
VSSSLVRHAAHGPSKVGRPFTKKAGPFWNLTSYEMTLEAEFGTLIEQKIANLCDLFNGFSQSSSPAPPG